MILTVNHNLNEKDEKELESYRKFLKRTRGVDYKDLQEAVEELTKHYLKSLMRQVESIKKEKISKAYRFANKAKQAEVDTLLGVTDE